MYIYIYLKPYGSCRPPHVEDVCDFQHWEVVMGKSRVRPTIFVEQKTKPNTAVPHEEVLFCHGPLKKVSPRTFGNKQLSSRTSFSRKRQQCLSREDSDLKRRFSICGAMQ